MTDCLRSPLSSCASQHHRGLGNVLQPFGILPQGLILDWQGFSLVSAWAAWLSRTSLHLSLLKEGKGICEIIHNFHQVVHKATYFVGSQVLHHLSYRS